MIFSPKKLILVLIFFFLFIPPLAVFGMNNVNILHEHKEAEKALKEMGFCLPPGLSAKVAYDLLRQGVLPQDVINIFFEQILKIENLYTQQCTDKVRMPITSLSDFVEFDIEFTRKTKAILDSKNCYDVQKHPINPPHEFFESFCAIEILLTQLIEHTVTGYGFFDYIQLNFQILKAHITAARNFLECNKPISLEQDLDNTLKLIEHEITIALLRSTIYLKVYRSNSCIQKKTSAFFKNVVTGSQVAFLDFCRRRPEINEAMYTHFKEDFDEINKLLCFTGDHKDLESAAYFFLEKIKKLGHEIK